jgi:hypothetical protein
MPGIYINECIIYQDDMSALSLEKKGSISSSKQTKHLMDDDLKLFVWGGGGSWA